MVSLLVATPQAVKTFLPISDCPLIIIAFTQLIILLWTSWHQLLQTSLADDFQIYISTPDLNWHTISLQTQCVYEYRITLQRPA